MMARHAVRARTVLRFSAIPQAARNVHAALNGKCHKAALIIFTAIVLAHWVEHIVQAVQVAMGWPLNQALGLLGLASPALVKSEWLHYVYNSTIWVVLIILAKGFAGSERRWWNAAIYIQGWHHFEHLLLLLQALTGFHLLGHEVPTSIAQLFAPRLELHFFYNTVATLPMVVAVMLHFAPKGAEWRDRTCDCVAVSAMWSRPPAMPNP